MNYPPIRVLSFWREFFLGLWQIKTVLLCLLFILAGDLAAMAAVSPCREQGIREAIGWFFGNGSGIQQLSWRQMVACIGAATFGYIFLGLVLAVIVNAIRNAETS